MIVSERFRNANYIFGMVCSAVACLIILADWRGVLGGPMIFLAVDAFTWECQIRRLRDEEKLRGLFEVQEARQ